MISILETKYTKPIEREYESWITQQIESYFQNIGFKCLLLAVSPKMERFWPADSYLSYSGVVLGLQFKKATLAQGQVDFSRLKWLLDQPQGQFEDILFKQEIFYCLPTFINRDFRSQALQHCLF